VRGNAKGENCLDTLTAYRDYLREMAKLASAISVLGWDQRTHMPKKGIAARAQVSGKLSKMMFEMSISDTLGGYLERLEGREDISLEETASVRRIGKQFRRHRSVPPELVEEFTIARSQSQAVWAEAKETSDFALFRPHLEKMVDYARRFAEHYGYEDHPYDGLLEEFEPGMTCRQLRGIIEPLRTELVPFIQRLVDEGSPPDTSVLNGTFDVDTQRRLARRALELIGYDFEAGALDDVTHPFTTTIAPGDVRVTNRYAEGALLSGLFAALHEGGHALYNQGMGDDLFYLRLARGASYGFHESQSRMVENMVGRSGPFWTAFQPVLVEFFPRFASASPDSLYRAANVVSPSLIRVEADEVTYNLHVMLRFELETGLIGGSIAVADLPSLWNEATERYLGIVPPNDGQGVLQDVHWSTGAFGYFPSYMLGNLYAAQLHATLREDLPDLDERIASGDLRSLVHWLREKIHRLGAIYEPAVLIERITGNPLDPSYFVQYVMRKYRDIYRL
jgi:carboxypeptidase Taq